MLKKLLFTCLIYVSVFNVKAQTLQIHDLSGNIINGDTVTFTEYYNSNSFANVFEQKKFIKFYNNSSALTVINLERTEESFIPGSYDYYCFGQQCLAPVESGTMPFRTSGDTMRIDPNSYGVGDAPFAVYLDSASSGVSLYKYSFVDKYNRNNRADVYIRWVVIDNSANGPNFQLRDSLGNDITNDTLTVDALYRDANNQSFEQKRLLRFYNNTPSKQKISLFRAERSTISGSYDQFCFGTSCSPLMAAGSNRLFLSPDSIEIQPNSYYPVDTAFTVRLDSAKSGEGLYMYSFSDKLNKNNIATIYVKWNVVDVTSIGEVELKNEFKVYPNPAESEAFIQFEKPIQNANTQIRVINLLGEEVVNLNVQQGTKLMELNVGSYTKGIYFLNVITDGARISTKKLIIR